MSQGMLTERVVLGPGRARDQMIEFLRQNDLGYEQDIEYSYCLMDGPRFAAAGSLAGPVLKCIAVDKDYRAMGLSARVVSALCGEAAQRGLLHLFLFTKPENVSLFQDMGFFPIAGCARAALLENKRDGLKSYLESLVPLRGPGTAGAVVLNANPFTLGHRYLVEQAVGHVDRLHLFVVGEDRSLICAHDREALVRQGVKDIPGVVVHGGTPYIISAATFPSYFLKSSDEAARVHARLDLTLFGRSIAPALGIARRFAGMEPLSPSTQLYNQAMLEVLPPLGVQVTVLARLERAGQVISASRVRDLWRQGDLKALRALVPDTTYAYLAAHPTVSDG